jgi:Ca2+-binding RTX toxin-like protein
LVFADAGNDTIEGGNGNDIIDFSAAGTDPLTINLGTGTASSLVLGTTNVGATGVDLINGF